MKSSSLFVTMIAASHAFTTPPINWAPRVDVGSSRIARFSVNGNQDDAIEQKSTKAPKSLDAMHAVTALLITFSSNAAYADSPDWGETIQPCWIDCINFPISTNR